ncbi:MAG: hypothetical protein ACK5L6_11080 [Anaerorhabdus sp.]|uniref:hypothetical protein n=1 Tax=Anaerorhabdus sp. TaxID=1872524 RepID=UPI003A853DCF
MKKEMKKVLMITLTTLMLVGCTEKEVTKVFELTGEDAGLTYTYVETIKAVKDVVMHEKIVSTLVFEDQTTEEIEIFKEILEAEVACPYGVLDADGFQTVGCSKFIDVEYTFDEATSTFVITENLRYKDAAKAKEDVVSVEAGGSYSNDEYYSIEMFEKDFLDAGYTIIE